MTIRGVQVILDRDLADLYGVETKVLNQSVKRNIERFPEHFKFQLSKYEMDELVTNSQYPPINVSIFRRSHDRFLCIDDVVYHIGASIKDLGKKWFAFAKMEVLTPAELIAKINE